MAAMSTQYKGHSYQVYPIQGTRTWRPGLPNTGPTIWPLGLPDTDYFHRQVYPEQDYCGRSIFPDSRYLDRQVYP